MAKILDGKWLAQQIQQSVRMQVQENLPKRGRAPGLAVILVGENPASKVYVGNKTKFAKESLFKTFDLHLPETSTQEEVASAIESLNNNTEVDGILLQLPLPGNLKQGPLLSLISPAKDADGLHPLNQGLLMQNAALLRACTPSASMLLIDLACSDTDYQIPLVPEKLPRVSLAGKHALVVGRSVLVGKPVGLMLLERDATVTYCHSKTRNLPELCSTADILVAAIGKEEFIKGSWIKEGAIVIDVGMNRRGNGKLCGDVEFSEASKRADAITPVPGGVGPMTVAMLIKNTLQSYLST